MKMTVVVLGGVMLTAVLCLSSASRLRPDNTTTVRYVPVGMNLFFYSSTIFINLLLDVTPKDTRLVSLSSPLTDIPKLTIC